MDIAKYIGLFLLKNQFCYLHGLGNLELRKKAATYDGQNLSAPHYDVVLSPTGSIDDSLANFIATNEQVSISKAANAIRDFSTHARAELKEGREVPIPSIGKFVESGNHIHFIADPNLQYVPPSIPSLKIAKRVDDEPVFNTVTGAGSEEVSNGGSVNWGKVITLVVALAAAVVAVIFGIRFLNQPTPEAPGTEQAPAPQTAVVTPPVTTPVDTTVVRRPDSAALQTPPPAATPAPANASRRVVLNVYTTRDRAEKRRRFLTTTSLGASVQLIAQDSTRFLIVIPYAGAPADTTRILDSLSRVYGSKATMFK